MTKVYWIRAQAPRRVLALLKHLIVDAELVEVDMMGGGFKDPEYIALNPNKKAPTLVDLLARVRNAIGILP